MQRASRARRSERDQVMQMRDEDERSDARRMGRVRVALTLMTLATLALLMLRRGHDYYAQGLALRAAHPDYRALNPAGRIGHGYGIVGTTLVAANLLYLVRRRLSNVLPEWIGSMKAWLNAHAFTGL